jgi:hypothetical protein
MGVMIIGQYRELYEKGFMGRQGQHTDFIEGHDE